MRTLRNAGVFHEIVGRIEIGIVTDLPDGDPDYCVIRITVRKIRYYADFKSTDYSVLDTGISPTRSTGAC